MENLKKLRLTKGLSQQALADHLELSQQTIYKYENGITEPNIDMLLSRILSGPKPYHIQSN